VYTIIIKRKVLGLILFAVLLFCFLVWNCGGKTAPEKNKGTLGVPVTSLAKDDDINLNQLKKVNLKKEEQTSNQAAFFVDYRLDRERTRGQQVELLREIVSNSAVTAESRQRAQEQLLNITRQMGQEAELENLIRAKGFPDAVVCLGEKGITVVVQKANLTWEETVNLTDIITRSTGFSEQNIILIPKV